MPDVLDHCRELVLTYCGQRNTLAPSHFELAILRAFEMADRGNTARLALGFPLMAQAWSEYRDGKLSDWQPSPTFTTR